MLSTVNARARLDRLPISGFHKRVLWLIGTGMFLDSFDIYLAGGVLGALVVGVLIADRVGRKNGLIAVATLGRDHRLAHRLEQCRNGYAAGLYALYAQVSDI